MNMTLAVVVAAIVILITALVIITIFGTGIGQVGSLVEAESYCRSQAAASCRATNSLPVTWDIETVKVNGAPMSCKKATGCHDCPCILDDGTGGGGSLVAKGKMTPIGLPHESVQIAKANLPAGGPVYA